MARVKNSNSLAENRKARHDYFVEETMEAGIELVGTEVKSIRGGKCNLKDCYADIKNGEIWVILYLRNAKGERRNEEKHEKGDWKHGHSCWETCCWKIYGVRNV